MITRILAGLALALFLAATATAQDGGYRIFISADMEGTTGAVTAEQLGPGGFEYQRFREIMTNEVLAAIEGARAAGATEFVVADSHGNMQNLLIERLPDDVTVVRGTPRPLSMMEGIQEGHFDGAIFLGYHASASNTEGVRAHTMSSARLSEVRINGMPASEGLNNAAIAGHFGVPVIMVSGGDAAVNEVAGALGDAERAVVKHAIGFHAARTMTPEAAYALIREKAQAAVARIDSFTPYEVETPVTMDLTFHFYQPAEILAWLDDVERTGARSVRYMAENPADAQKFLSFVLAYDSNAAP